jgi:hypothetical protein
MGFMTRNKFEGLIMSNEKDVSFEKKEERLEDVSSVNNIDPDEYKKAKSSGLTKLDTLTVTWENYKAELTVEYWWSTSGRLLYGYARQYRVTSNGNNSGNIFFGVNGAEGQSWNYELTARAVQNGEWQDIAGGGWVAAPLKSGWLYFKYVFDRSGT